jgi:hypothetical protein
MTLPGSNLAWLEVEQKKKKRIKIKKSQKYPSKLSFSGKPQSLPILKNLSGGSWA